jgi:hypothetical protein
VPGTDGQETLLDAGANPPNGVLLTYALRESAEVELSVLDASGESIATVRGPSGEPGVHRVVWDMRYRAPVSVEGATFWDEAGAAGPLASPGRYTARLTAGQTVLEQPFELLVDPRIDVAQQELQEQFKLLLDIRDRLSETHTAANRIAAVRRQLADWRQRPEAAELASRLEALDAVLAEIDQQLIERTPGLSYAYPIRLNAKLAALASMVGSADAAPTRQSREVFAALRAHLDAQLERLQHLLDEDLASINAALHEQNVAIIGGH